MEHPENKYGDSSTEDEAGSQTTEDEVPERQAPAAPPPPPPPAPVASSVRERPHYELRHTLRGHTSSISAVKFSPDGTLLASCGMSGTRTLHIEVTYGWLGPYSERQGREDLVPIYRRAHTQFEWTHEGIVGHRLVIGQCEPRVCFRRSYHPDLGGRYCTFTFVLAYMLGTHSICHRA